MRFNIGSFLTGLTAVAAGEQQGRREARLHNQQQAQLALVNHLRQLAEKRADEEMQMNRQQFQRSGEQWTAAQAQQERFHTDLMAGRDRDDARADKQLEMQTDPTRILETELYKGADNYQNSVAYRQNVPAFASGEARPGLVDAQASPGFNLSPDFLGAVGLGDMGIPTSAPSSPRTIGVGRLLSEVEGERKSKDAAQAQSIRIQIAAYTAKARAGTATEREKNALIKKAGDWGYDITGALEEALGGIDLPLPGGQTAPQVGMDLKGKQGDLAGARAGVVQQEANTHRMTAEVARKNAETNRQREIDYSRSVDKQVATAKSSGKWSQQATKQFDALNRDLASAEQDARSWVNNTKNVRRLRGFDFAPYENGTGDPSSIPAGVERTAAEKLLRVNQMRKRRDVFLEQRGGGPSLQEAPSIRQSGNLAAPRGPVLKWTANPRQNRAAFVQYTAKQVDPQTGGLYGPAGAERLANKLQRSGSTDWSAGSLGAH